MSKEIRLTKKRRNTRIDELSIVALSRETFGRLLIDKEHEEELMTFYDPISDTQMAIYVAKNVLKHNMKDPGRICFNVSCPDK